VRRHLVDPGPEHALRALREVLDQYGVVLS
jgi:hypothetical protein